jgi:hypothetical protein
MGLLDFLRPQAQAPGAMQQPSGLSRLLDPSVALPMAAGLLGNQGNSQNFAQGFALATPGIQQQRELQAQTAESNKTWDWLAKNAPEYGALRDSGMSGTDALGLYAKQKYAKPDDGQGYINAGAGHLFNTQTGEWISAPGGGSEGAAGLVPVWLEDEQGNPVLGQMTKDGKVIRSEIDPNLKPVGPYEKSFETNRGAKAGAAVGEAEGALPGVTQMAQIVNQQVEDLKNDSSLGRVLGPIDSRTPNIFGGAVRAQGKIDQLKGGAFLQARQMLKGGGAITDYEGQKAEAAFARLNQAQSEDDFKAALDEFNFYVQQGLQKLQAQAGQTRMGPQAAPAGQRFRFNPATGELE